MKKKITSLGLILGIIFLVLASKPLIAPTLQKPQDTIYNNQTFGFSLSYPASWQIEKWDLKEAAKLTNVPDGTILFQSKFYGKDGHFEVLVWENKIKASVRQWLTWYRHEDLILSDVPPEENYSFAGFSAIRYLQQKTSRNIPLLYIFFTKDDLIYELTEERADLKGVEATTSAELALPVYDSILQSFKFL